MSVRQTRFVAAALVFVVLLSQVLLYPGLDVVVAALGAPAALDGGTYFLAAEYAAFVVFAGVWGALSDRAGRRRPFLAASALAGAVGFAALGGLGLATSRAPGSALAANAFPIALAIRVFQGGATIGVLTLSLTTLMDLEGGHGKNMGAGGIAIGLGTAVGAPLGGQLYEVGPLVPLFVTAALLLVAAALTRFVVETSPDGHRRGPGAVLDGLARRPALVVPYAFGFLDRLTAGFFALVGTLYFRQVFELGTGETGLVLACFFAPFALLQYPFGVLSDRIGRTVPVVAGSALYGVVVIGVGLAPTLPLAAGGMVAVGVVGAFMAPATMALVTDLADADDRGVAMGGFNVFGSVGFLAGVLVGGTVADEVGYFEAFLVVGGLEVVVALLAIPAFWHIRSQLPASAAGDADRSAGWP